MWSIFVMTSDLTALSSVLYLDDTILKRLVSLFQIVVIVVEMTQFVTPSLVVFFAVF